VTRDTKAKLGLVAAILTALSTVAPSMSEEWKHGLLVAGAVGGAISAWLHSAPSGSEKDAAE
jgi:hypothetical protein